MNSTVARSPFQRESIERGKEPVLHESLSAAERVHKCRLACVGITDKGKFRKLVSLDVLKRVQKNRRGKLILVTAMNPTKEGE